MILSRHDEEAGGIRSPCKGSSRVHNPLRRNQSDAVDCIGRIRVQQAIEYPAGLTGVPDGRLLSSIAAQSGVARLMAGETWCSDRSAGIG
jgi:hypothetical protein